MNGKEPHFPICSPLGRKQIQLQFFTRAMSDSLKIIPHDRFGIGRWLGSQWAGKKMTWNAISLITPSWAVTQQNFTESQQYPSLLLSLVIHRQRSFSICCMILTTIRVLMDSSFIKKSSLTFVHQGNVWCILLKCESDSPFLIQKIDEFILAGKGHVSGGFWVELKEH